jgi:hypothetical protein
MREYIGGELELVVFEIEAGAASVLLEGASPKVTFLPTKRQVAPPKQQNGCLLPEFSWTPLFSSFLKFRLCDIIAAISIELGVVGKCIHCGTTARPLQDEHVVPYGS